jgi:pilus assembly protein CpaC
MVNAAADSLVLSGAVADAVKVDRAMALAGAYSGKKVINLLRVTDAQQVMLEVKVAEVSKTLVDKLGAKFNMSRTNGSWTYSILSDFLSGMLPGTPTRGGPGSISAFKDPTKMLQLDAEFKDGLFKILAEPNIMAISGQEGSFLAGGKIFIPVAQSSATGASTITLEEREFGVGLRFTPTVLEDGRINLRVTPEVSELSATGTEVRNGDTRSVLPSISTRRASTTVQLKDGQSFAIGGLIKSHVTETMNRFPLLGEIPILGMLFRSSEFQNERTELLFVITPRLVKPLPPDYALPTDAFVPPDRSEFFLEGKLEGTPGGQPEPKAEPGAAGGGFQMK